MGKIGRGWQLMKMSLSVVRSDKELLIFPILSMVLSIVIILSFLGVTFLTVGIGGFFTPAAIAMFFVMYLVLYFFVIYFNVAVVGCAMIRYDGGDPTVGDGFRVANKKIGAIFKWAMVSATVGLILKAIEQRGGVFGKIVAFVGGVAWSIATYLILPVLVFENAGVFGSVRRSVEILRKTWGEAFIGGLSFFFIFFLLGLLGLIPIFLGFYVGGLTGIIFGLVIAMVYWVGLAAVSSVAQTAFVTALYRYATTGKVAPGFSPESITDPWMGAPLPTTPTFETGPEPKPAGAPEPKPAGGGSKPDFDW